MLVNNQGLETRKKPWRWLRPDYLVQSVADIDFNYLKRRGVKAIFIDLDGTVVARSTFEIPSGIKKALRNQPLAVYIATNRSKSRDLKNLKDDLGATGVIHPSGLLRKPLSIYYRRALKQYGLKPQQVVMVGDRYLQDILGANRLGISTIAVRKFGLPINQSDRLLSALEAWYSERLARKYQEISQTAK